MTIPTSTPTVETEAAPAPTAPPTPPGPPEQPAPPEDQQGFPAGTPLAEMTSEQQAAYWKSKARKHEQTWQSVIDKNLTPEQVLAMQERLAEADRAALTDQERAIADAREAGRVEALRQTSTAAAEATFRLAMRSAQPDISDDDLSKAVQLTNVSALVDENGGINEQLVLEAVKYRSAVTASVPGPTPDMGQGRRGTTAAPSGISAGAALFNEKRGKSNSAKE